MASNPSPAPSPEPPHAPAPGDDGQAVVGDHDNGSVHDSGVPADEDPDEDRAANGGRPGRAIAGVPRLASRRRGDRWDPAVREVTDRSCRAGRGPATASRGARRSRRMLRGAPWRLLRRLQRRLLRRLLRQLLRQPPRRPRRLILRRLRPRRLRPRRRPLPQRPPSPTRQPPRLRQLLRRPALCCSINNYSKVCITISGCGWSGY